MIKNALAFSVAGVRLGIDVTAIREVIPTVKLVTPPEMPPILRGFVSMDQRLIPVIYLEHFLGTTPTTTALALADKILIAELDGLIVAWVVDPHLEPIAYRTSETLPLPAGQVVNDCATRLVPGTPPTIILEPDSILLEAERLRLQQLQIRTRQRLEQLESESEPPPAPETSEVTPTPQ